MAPNARLRHFQSKARSSSSFAKRTSRARFDLQISMTHPACFSSPAASPSSSTISTAPIVAVHLLAAVRPGAEPDDLAVRQHYFEAENMVGRDAVFQRVWSAGVGGHVAADGAGRLAGRVRREEQAPRLYRVGNPGI